MSNDDREVAAKQRTLNEISDRLRAEGFDAHLLIATWQLENGETAAIHANGGNWYAQWGLAEYFIARRDTNASIEEQNRQD